MKRLIRNILLENVEKAANSIANSIFNKLEMKPNKGVYNSAYDMLEDFNNIMINYTYENWGKYFYYANEEDNEDEPEFVSIKYPKGETYSTDEMESEMFYRFIDELKDEGFITEDETGENDVVIKNILVFYYNDIPIKLQVNEKNNELEINLRGLYTYDTIMKIISEYGIDKNEELGGKISELIIKKILDKLESMGVREKYGMIKFKENV